MAEGTCALPGCDNYGPLKRTWCVAHYLRWWKHGGDVEPPPSRRGQRPPRSCEVEGCDRKHYAKGLCSMHMQRWARYGSTDDIPNARWLGDAAGYSAVHERLVRTRGSASTHACAHCGGQAQDWAYDMTCPNEKQGERHGRMLAFSTDPDRYMPLCRPCHKVFDNAGR